MSETTERAIVTAAVMWWRQHRPVDWSILQHADQPAVNTSTPAEADLAVAVRDHLAAPLLEAADELSAMYQDEGAEL